MLSLLALLMANSLIAEVDQTPPTLDGIFPPGITVGSDATWTVAGRDLLGVDAVVVDPPAGLHCEVIRVDPAGSRLDLVAHATADAAPGVRGVRVDGPRGVSNLRLIRVDPLRQVVAGERMGKEKPLPTVAAGSAVADTLGPLEVGRYRIEGPPGSPILLDWEARRLGVALDPLVSALGPSGRALGMARTDPLAGGDARLRLVVPPEGWLTAEVRDNTYRGSSRAHHRLRVVVDPPPDPPAPPDDPRLNSPEPIALGPDPAVIRGTLPTPGAVARLRLRVRVGERLRVDCRAELPGSPLDPVVTLRDAGGRVVAENDDAPTPPGLEPLIAPDGSPPTAARVDFTPTADGLLTVEVADRSQGGGPGFGFVVDVDPLRPDFTLIIPPPELGSGPGWGGAWNLAPGESARIPLVIVPSGYPGTIEVRVEGLPPGVEAEPIRVRTAPPKRPGTRAAAGAAWDAPPVADALQLRAAATTAPVRGAFRVVGSLAAGPGELPWTRVGAMTVGLDAGTGAPHPVGHRLTEFPVRVVDRPR